MFNIVLKYNLRTWAQRLSFVSES